MKTYYVYILASKKNGTLYTGVTSDLKRRVFQHKSDLIKCFTSRYKVHNLVYYEHTTDIHSALSREKAIKEWKRLWKLQIINKINPLWEDLYNKL